MHDCQFGDARLRTSLVLADDNQPTNENVSPRKHSLGIWVVDSRDKLGQQQPTSSS